MDYFQQLKIMFSSDKFLIVKYMKQFILSLDEIIINYPNKEMVIKNRLHSDSLDILELIYRANLEEDIANKIPYQNEILCKINMLDFYLEKSYKKKYISEKLCQKKCNELLKISKMVYQWKNAKEQDVF